MATDNPYIRRTGYILKKIRIIRGRVGFGQSEHRYNDQTYEMICVETIYSSAQKQPSDLYQLLKAITKFVSGMMKQNDLMKIAKETMKTIGQQFKMSEMIFALWDDESRRFKILAAYGYPPDVEKDILQHEYGHDWISEELQDKFRIAEDVYFINAEDWEPVEVDNLLMDKDKADEEREYINQWHERDFFEFVVKNHNGDIIGTIEMNDSESTDLPDMNTLLSISIFAKAAGIILETAKSRAKQKEYSERADSLISLMSHDIGKNLEVSGRLFESMKRARIDDDLRKRGYEDAMGALTKSMSLIEKVKRLRKIESRPYSLFVSMDIITYANRSAEKIKQNFPGLKILVKSDKKSIYMKCDPSMEELILACLDVIVATKKDMEMGIIVEILEQRERRTVNELEMSFASGDIDFMSWRKIALDLRNADPQIRKMPTTSDLFGKFLIIFIARKYGGSVTVDEYKVPGFDVMGRLLIKVPII